MKELLAGAAAVLDALPYPAMLVDENHRTILANAALIERAAPGTEEDLVGKRCCRLLHGPSWPAKRCPLAEAVRTGVPVDREIHDPDGNQRILASVYPTTMVTEQGLPVYLHLFRELTPAVRA